MAIGPISCLRLRSSPKGMIERVLPLAPTDRLPRRARLQINLSIFSVGTNFDEVLEGHEIILWLLL